MSHRKKQRSAEEAALNGAAFFVSGLSDAVLFALVACFDG